MENVKILKFSRRAAGLLDLRPPPPARGPGGRLGLDVHERLEERVVVEGMIARWTLPATEGRVKHPGLVDESETLQLSNVHRHFLPGIDPRLRDKIRSFLIYLCCLLLLKILTWSSSVSAY